MVQLFRTNINSLLKILNITNAGMLEESSEYSKGFYPFKAETALNSSVSGLTKSSLVKRWSLLVVPAFDKVQTL